MYSFVKRAYISMYVCMYIRLKQLTNRNIDNTVDNPLYGKTYFNIDDS